MAEPRDNLWEVGVREQESTLELVYNTRDDEPYFPLVSNLPSSSPGLSPLSESNRGYNAFGLGEDWSQFLLEPVERISTNSSYNSQGSGDSQASTVSEGGSSDQLVNQVRSISLQTTVYSLMAEGGMISSRNEIKSNIMSWDDVKISEELKLKYKLMGMAPQHLELVNDQNVSELHYQCEDQVRAYSVYAGLGPWLGPYLSNWHGNFKVHDEPAISLNHMLDYQKSVIITDAQAWLENGVQAYIIAGIRHGKVEDPLETARLPMGALSTAACHEANGGKLIGLVMIWSPVEPTIRISSCQIKDGLGPMLPQNHRRK